MADIKISNAPEVADKLEHLARHLVSDRAVVQEAAELIRALYAALADGWMPIETAPQDGTEIDVWFGNDPDPYRQTDVFWKTPRLGRKKPCWCKRVFDECFGLINQAVGDPTHWRPQPAPPTINASGEGRNG